jgi:hypothetical protein
VVFVRTGTREQIQAYPYVPFFPSTRAMIDKLLPNHAELREVFETVGLQLKASELITQTVAPNWLAYADKLAAGGDSVLSRLSHEEFESGLAAVRHHAVDARDEPITEPIDLFVFQC